MYVFPLELWNKGKSRGLPDCTAVTLVKHLQMFPIDILAIALSKVVMAYLSSGLPQQSFAMSTTSITLVTFDTE